MVEATIEDVSLRGEGNGIAVAQWATAVLNNGVGDYQTAMTAAQSASDHPGEIVSPTWALVELIEAAARIGESETAAEALRRLEAVTTARGTNWALGVQARSRALLSDDDAAERLYRESIERLGRTQIRADLARAHLLYGEWLRRQRRRVDARAQLRIAHDMLDAMGMDAFAERAGRELHATGETTRKPSVATADEQLTAQEALIARMARDGLSNPEIPAACSSALAPSSTTYARSSPSSASSHARNSTAYYPTDGKVVATSGAGGGGLQGAGRDGADRP